MRAPLEARDLGPVKAATLWPGSPAPLGTECVYVPANAECALLPSVFLSAACLHGWGCCVPAPGSCRSWSACGRLSRRSGKPMRSCRRASRGPRPRSSSTQRCPAPPPLNSLPHDLTPSSLVSRPHSFQGRLVAPPSRAGETWRAWADPCAERVSGWLVRCAGCGR